MNILNKFLVFFVVFGVFFHVTTSSPLNRENSLSFDDIPILNSKHVNVKNRDTVLQKLRNIAQDGFHNLRIVTDFDATLTKQHVNGIRINDSYTIFWEHCRADPECGEKMQIPSHDNFRVIEKDPHVEYDEKILVLNAWNQFKNKSFTGLKMTPERIRDVARTHNAPLRTGTDVLFKRLRDADVPILVFSAGLGDMVDAVLANNDLLLKNVKVASNFLKFEGSRAQGFVNKEMIHIFNKNENVIDRTSYKEWLNRPNVIVMGDNIGDSTMTDGSSSRNKVLKIGFLYEDKIDKYLPAFENAFDIVVIDDQTMEIAKQIIDVL